MAFCVSSSVDDLDSSGQYRPINQKFSRAGATGDTADYAADNSQGICAIVKYSMNFLIDTNIVIPMEPGSTVDLEINTPLALEFYRLANRSSAL